MWGKEIAPVVLGLAVTVGVCSHEAVGYLRLVLTLRDDPPARLTENIRIKNIDNKTYCLARLEGVVRKEQQSAVSLLIKH